MADRAEVLNRARTRLANMRADRESEARQRLQNAYEQLPRLREIDHQLRLTMAMAAQSVFAQGADAGTAMEQAKQENLSLQKERQALIESRFGKDYLNENPLCARCGGSGYLGSTMCNCLEELCKQEQKKELSMLIGGEESFGRFRLEYYPDETDARYGVSPRLLMQKNYKICRQYAQNFGKDAGNLLFIGDTGLGKTFLSACIADAVAEKGYWVIYESATRLFQKLEQAKFGTDEEMRQQVQNAYQCDLLILDDLGTELPGQFVTASLYQLLNERLLNGKSMIVSTNLLIEEIRKRYSPQIASRLEGNFNRLTFVGEDIRVLKNRGL